MDIVKLGKKGQVSLPAGVLRKLGLEGAATLIVEATDDGAVVLRPAAVYPIELYSDTRVKGFEKACSCWATSCGIICEFTSDSLHSGASKNGAPVSLAANHDPRTTNHDHENHRPS